MYSYEFEYNGKVLTAHFDAAVEKDHNSMGGYYIASLYVDELYEATDDGEAQLVAYDVLPQDEQNDIEDLLATHLMDKLYK